MMNCKRIPGKVLVKGRACAGRVTLNPTASARGRVLVRKELTTGDYKHLRDCVGAICESGGPNDHPSVMGRIMGRPVLLVDEATQRFREGDWVTLVPGEGGAYPGRHPLPSEPLTEVERSARQALRERGVKAQVSIIDEHDIYLVKAVEAGRAVDSFFVRQELCPWVKYCLSPFEFLKRMGGRHTRRLLADCLRPCVRALRPGQRLNFRALDMRSDESPVPEPGQLPEKNPHLGNHGVRRLLTEPTYHAAEIRAAAAAQRSRPGAVLYSVPFINDEQEMVAVRAAIEKNAKPALPVGVFVETPAAVSELPYILGHGVQMVYIGTKDLTQTILACDRGNSSVQHLYNPRSRPVVSAIERVLEVCDGRGVPTCLFASTADVPFFLDRFPSLGRVSMCCSEYLDLFRDDPAAA